jgi:hypothetical protein
VSDQPDRLFPTPRRAGELLVGAGLFWGAFLVFAAMPKGDNQQPPAILVLLSLAGATVGIVLVTRAQRSLHERLTGQKLKPWPVGFPNLSTQIRSTLPSTLMAAARESGVGHPRLVVATLYAELALGLVLFFVSFGG